MKSHHPHTRPLACAFAAVLTLVGAVLAALALAAPAAAATPCGKKILNDWFDNGRVDRLYPLHCYEEAIDAIPRDIRDYADAEEVISRALQFALRDELAPGGCDPSPDANAKDACTRTVGPAGGNNGGTGPGGGGPNGEVAPSVDASGPSTIPVPLLVLGGLSLALLAAGGIGYLSRRRQLANGDDFDDDSVI